MQSFDSDVRYEPVHSGNLKDVMANAIERWFIDTLRNAKNGDVNQAALLAEMLATGYGCNKDAEEARYWKQVARNGGARRLEGVYDRLP
jgi:TPR repeat protein